MFTFPELLKEIRNSIGLNQEDFSKALWVSKIYIAQIETWKREPSKKFVKNLSEKLWVSSFSIMPFLSANDINKSIKLSKIEEVIYNYGVKLQKELISKKSKKLIQNFTYD